MGGAVEDVVVLDVAELAAEHVGELRIGERVDALRVFAESAYYHGVVGKEGGLSQSECDGKVAEILSR